MSQVASESEDKARSAMRRSKWIIEAAMTGMLSNQRCWRLHSTLEMKNVIHMHVKLALTGFFKSRTMLGEYLVVQICKFSNPSLICILLEHRMDLERLQFTIFQETDDFLMLPNLNIRYLQCTCYPNELNSPQDAQPPIDYLALITCYTHHTSM